MTDHSVSLLDRVFALTIAFLLPGLILLFGISTVNPTVEGWFGAASAGPTLAGFLFVVFAACALGMVVTTLRWFLFERVTIPGLRCPWVPAAAPFDHATRVGIEAQYIDLRNQFYYHYLAYANTAVALPLAVAVWKIGSTPEPTWLAFSLIGGGALACAVVLGMGGCEAVRRYDNRRSELRLHTATAS